MPRGTPGSLDGVGDLGGWCSGHAVVDELAGHVVAMLAGKEGLPAGAGQERTRDERAQDPVPGGGSVRDVDAGELVVSVFLEPGRLGV
jgi:hypothetical protein